MPLYPEPADAMHFFAWMLWFFGIIFAGLTWLALKRGVSGSRGRIYRRSEQPGKFWAMWSVSALMTAALLGFGVQSYNVRCYKQELLRLPSPSGDFDAVLFDRFCNRPSNHSVQVAVVRRGARPEGAGNAYVPAKDTHSPAPAVAWNAPHTLTITYRGTRDKRPYGGPAEVSVRYVGQ
jgi:hypothetical protein